MLTKEQIDYLFQFCRERGVIYYDMQVELVDHLANAIEKDLGEHPEWDFQKALNAGFASFGPGGFNSLSLDKSRTARAYCRNLFWSVLKGMFSWPKFTFTALWLYGSIILLYLIPPHHPFMLLTGLILVLQACIFVEYRHWENFYQKTGKRFVLIDMSGVNPIFYYANSIPLILGILRFSPSGSILFSLWHNLSFNFLFEPVYFAYLVMGSAYIRTIRQLKGRLKANYPEIFKPA